MLNICFSNAILFISFIYLQCVLRVPCRQSLYHIFSNFKFTLMTNYSYLVTVEGTHYPPIFIDARRFNRLVTLATSLDRAVTVSAVCRGYDIISVFDLSVFSKLLNYLKHSV